MHAEGAYEGHRSKHTGDFSDDCPTLHRHRPCRRHALHDRRPAHHRPVLTLIFERIIPMTNTYVPVAAVSALAAFTLFMVIALATVGL